MGKRHRYGPKIGPSERKGAKAYQILVSEANEGVVMDGEVEVFRSRSCRLSVQAERLAQDWIDEQTGKPIGDITLVVQNVVIDPDTLFGRN